MTLGPKKFVKFLFFSLVKFYLIYLKYFMAKLYDGLSLIKGYFTSLTLLLVNKKSTIY